MDGNIVAQMVVISAVFHPFQTVVFSCPGDKSGLDPLKTGHASDKQGKDSDSGVGGLAGKAFAPKTSLAPDRDSHGMRQG